MLASTLSTTARILLPLACCVSSGWGPGDLLSTVSSQPLLRPPWDHHGESVPVGDHPRPLNSVPIHRRGIAGIMRGIAVLAGAGIGVGVLVFVFVSAIGRALQIGYRLGVPVPVPWVCRESCCWGPNPLRLLVKAKTKVVHRLANTGGGVEWVLQGRWAARQVTVGCLSTGRAVRLLRAGLVGVSLGTLEPGDWNRGCSPGSALGGQKCSGVLLHGHPQGDSSSDSGSWQIHWLQSVHLEHS